MSIAGTATSLDAFPTAPARTLMVRVRLLHAAFSSGPTPPAMTAPRPLSRPPQLLQISIVGAPGEPGARRAGKPAGTTVGGIPFRSRRSEEHTSELQSLMRISYAVFCLKKTTNTIKLTKKQP